MRGDSSSGSWLLRCQGRTGCQRGTAAEVPRQVAAEARARRAANGLSLTSSALGLIPISPARFQFSSTLGRKFPDSLLWTSSPSRNLSCGSPPAVGRSLGPPFLLSMSLAAVELLFGPP